MNNNKNQMLSIQSPPDDIYEHDAGNESISFNSEHDLQEAFTGSGVKAVDEENMAK